jgi:hypothetical protein
MQQKYCISRFMVLTLKLPIGPVHIGFSSVGHSYWNRESDIHFRGIAAWQKLAMGISSVRSGIFVEKARLIFPAP